MAIRYLSHSAWSDAILETIAGATQKAEQAFSSKARRMSENPEKVGKYRILGVAGRGGMGTVYIGRDPFNDRKVAIKVCSVGDPSDNAARLALKMFFSEAQSAGVLENPNILRVFGAG